MQIKFTIDAPDDYEPYDSFNPEHDPEEKRAEAVELLQEALGYDDFDLEEVDK